jgi:hypothetical protein
VGRAPDADRTRDVQGAGAMPAGQSPKDRYAALAAAYADAFNLHDLNRALSFFSENATLTVNRRALKSRPAIRAFLAECGATTDGASLAAARMMIDASFFTGDALLVLGRIYGRHQGEISGFAATGINTAIAYASFYRFDEAGRCTSADITLNWGAFFGIR